MTTPLACVPVCWTFAALFLIGVLMYAAGAGRGDPDETPAATLDPSTAGRSGPPPWWVIVLIFVGVVGGMLLLSLVNADY